MVYKPTYNWGAPSCGFPIISRLPTSLCWNCYTVSRHPLTWLMNLPDQLVPHKSRLPHGVVIAHKAWTEGISKGPRNMLHFEFDAFRPLLLHAAGMCFFSSSKAHRTYWKSTNPPLAANVLFTPTKNLPAYAFRRHRQFEQSGHLSRMGHGSKPYPDGTHSSQMLPCCPDDGIG